MWLMSGGLPCEVFSHFDWCMQQAHWLHDRNMTKVYGRSAPESIHPTSAPSAVVPPQVYGRSTPGPGPFRPNGIVVHVRLCYVYVTLRCYILQSSHRQSDTPVKLAVSTSICCVNLKGRDCRDCNNNVTTSSQQPHSPLHGTVSSQLHASFPL